MHLNEFPRLHDRRRRLVHTLKSWDELQCGIARKQSSNVVHCWCRHFLTTDGEALVVHVAAKGLQLWHHQRGGHHPTIAEQAEDAHSIASRIVTVTQLMQNFNS
jgi:hypothetical protein